MQLKNNDSFLRASLSPALSPSRRILHLSTFVSLDHCHGYLQSKTSSVASSRSIGLFVRFY